MIPPVITQKQDEDAQSLCLKMQNSNKRTQAYINFMGAMFFADFMLNAGFIVNTKRSLFKSPKLYYDFNIVDVYCNYHRIYVLVTNGSNNVKVPILHVRYDILPEAYAVVDINLSDKHAKVLGMIEPDQLKNSPQQNGNYIFPVDKLKSKMVLIEKFQKYAEKQHSIGKHLDCIRLFDGYIENKLQEDDNKRLISHILTCETCKKRLLEMLETKYSEDSFEEKIYEEKYNASVNLSDNEGQKNNNGEIYHSDEKTDFDPEKEKLKFEALKFLNEKKPEKKQNTEDIFLEKIKAETADNLNQLKGAIDIIYEGNEGNSLQKQYFKFKSEIPFKTKKLMILTASILLVLLVLIIGALNMSASKKSEEIEAPKPFTFEEGTETNSADSVNYEIKFPALRKNKGFASVSKVSWEVSSNVTKDSQKRFLQQTGKTIQLNLQNDLLLTRESIINSKVKYEIVFYKDGTVESIETLKSTGSDAIDEVIKQSIQNTMYYMRPPKGSFVGKKNSLILDIEF